MTDQIPQFDYVETLWNLRLGVNNYEEHMSYYKRVFDINVPTILLKLAKAQKDTLLHRLIRVECDLGFRAIADNYDLQTLQNYIKFYLDE